MAKSWGQNVHCNKSSEPTHRKYDSVLACYKLGISRPVVGRRDYEKMYIPYSCTFIVNYLISIVRAKSLFVAKQCSNRRPRLLHCSWMFVSVQQQQFPHILLLSSLSPTKSEITLSRSGCISWWQWSNSPNVLVCVVVEFCHVFNLRRLLKLRSAVAGIVEFNVPLDTL